MMYLKRCTSLVGLLIFFLLTGLKIDGSVYNIINFGAKGDGRTVNTAAINEAIRQCNKNGGGTILVPAGIFVSGTIELLSNTNFHLEAGSVILGSKDTLDYKQNPNPLFDEGYNRYGLIHADRSVNISITGEGEINGNGTYFMNGLDKPHLGHDFERKYTRQGNSFMKAGSIFEDGPVSYNFRPGLMIQMQYCQDIHITDVKLKDAPEWTVRLADCDEVVVKGITIDNNQLIPNSDGIHCTNSRNVRISDAHIHTGDDCIIVSGFGEQAQNGGSDHRVSIGNKTGFAENVTVDNCILSSRSACIRIGYGYHPIRNLVFSNIVMYDSNRGIGIFSRDKSSIENVLFSNIIIHTRLHSGHWWGKGEPIHISAVKDSKDGNAGKIDNIRFVNVSAFSETGIVVYGSAGSIISNLLFDHVQLTINKGKYSDFYGGNFDLRPAFPMSLALFRHDIPGFFACYVSNLKLMNFELTWGHSLPAYFTNGIAVSNFKDITIDNFSGQSAFPLKHKLASVYLSEGTHVRIINCADQPKKSFLLQNRVK